MGDGANRQAILEALGVDVWVVRDGPSIPPATTLDRAQEAPAQKDPAQEAADRLRSSLAAGASDPSDLSSRKTSKPTPGQAERPIQAPAKSDPDEKAMAAPPVAPFMVICLSKGDALILIEPTDVKAGRRFAVDVLSAVSGIWGGGVAQLAFDWPQPGIANDEATVTRALGAFISKQAGDNGDGITLIGGELLERLSEPPDGCVILPPIDALMTRGDLKRTLWAELSSREQ